MLHIKSAKYLKDLILQICFQEYTGQYIVDMQDYIKSNSDFKLINDLNNVKHFKDFTLDHGVIFWANGFDIAPEYLFFLANKDDKKYKTMFKEWGYIK